MVWYPSHDLHLPHLLLPDLVIAVRYEVFPHLGQGKSNPRMGLCRGSEGCYLNMEVFMEVLVLWVS